MSRRAGGQTCEVRGPAQSAAGQVLLRHSNPRAQEERPDEVLTVGVLLDSHFQRRLGEARAGLEGE